jgi:putative ABC transport system permease protein
VWLDDEELRFHLEMRLRDYLAQGYTREQAERAARERLGDLGQVQRELRSHERRRERMSRVWQDARIALRGFRRSPAFTASAVLILGIGMGMAVAMWTVFTAVLLRPLPLAAPDRVVLPRVHDKAGVDISLSVVDVDRIRREAKTMSAVAGYAHGGAFAWPMVDGDRPFPIKGSQVQWQFFQVLGVQPVIGRLLDAGDDSLSHVMVLSYDAWQRIFSGDLKVVGRHFRQTMSGAQYTIVGVAPPGIDLPAATDYWSPMPFPQAQNVVARLAPGATPAMARDEFRRLVEQALQDAGNPAGDVQRTTVVGGADAQTFDVAVVGDVRPMLIVLVVAVTLLLLLVSINVGNLLLLRASARTRELAVRRALGATYADIVRQLVVESTALAAAGATLGIAIAEIARRALIAAAPPQLPRIDAIRVAGTPVGTGVAVALGSLLLFGVAPALISVRRNPTSPLRLDNRSGMSTRQRGATRQLLVASQVALALILLAGAGLLARSVQRLQSIDLGYRPEHLSIVGVTFPYASYKKYPDDMFRLWNGIAPRIRALPGVTGLTTTQVYPLIGPNFFTATWQTEGQTPEEASHSPMTPIDVADGSYFQTLGIPIQRGRGILDSDRQNSEPVAVVSASTAARYWPGQNPLGKRIRMAFDSTDKWRTVVGVAGDTHWRTLRDATPMIYLSYLQSGWQGYVVLRTTGTLTAMLPGIRSAVRDFDPGLVVWQPKTMDDYLAEPLAQPRMSAMLLSTFGLVALALAAIGLFGLMATAVREQTRDIGVRMALGATPGQVRNEILRRAMAVSALGAAVGIACALAGSRLIASLLFEVSPTDPFALLGACAVLLGVALIAAYLPAHHASRVDPARAILGE